LFEFAREFIFHKDATLRGTEVGATLLETLLIEGFVDDTDSWTAANTDADKRCDMVQVSLSEPSGTIEGINPYYHLVFKELIWKFIIVEIGFRSGHTINLL
jgi:hypothetical protein